MFKVEKQLTNVRPAKSETPELGTTPTKGNIKLNEPGAAKIGANVGDFVAIVEASDDNGKGLYIVKGNAGSESDAQFGSKLSSASGKMGGSLLFSSENAYRELEGNDKVNKIYEIADGIEDGGKTYFKLNFVREEAKAERKASEAKA